jgi:phosphatidate cytidylyltransferase
MKSRLVGALFIAVVLIPTFFFLPEDWFKSVFYFCMAWSIAEILATMTMRPFSSRLGTGGVFQLSALYLAMIFCMLVRKEEIAFVVIASFLSDTGAFAFGKLLGKHKATFVSKISPNKTIEGYIGGMIFPFLALPIAWLIGIRFEITAALLIYLLISGPIAEIGDLLGSATKRELGIKDSGEVLWNVPLIRWVEYPLKGMGGYLDRVDSISLGIVLFTIIVPRQ